MAFDGLSAVSAADVTSLAAVRALSHLSTSSSAPVPMSQTTLKTSISCTGIGLHTGKKVSMTLHPAAENTGVIFRRTDIAGGNAEIPALATHVLDSRLCTVIGLNAQQSIGTIEHLMSALVAMGVDNVVVEVNAPELPIMDGSAAPFVFLIECAGLVTQSATRKALKVLKPVTVSHGMAEATLLPSATPRIDFEIDFPVAAIGQQAMTFSVSSSAFAAEIARARTFCLIDDIAKMREAGLALGGSLDNAIVVNGAEILNEDGLRYSNEFVRHKVLDAIGDLALAGKPILGHYIGKRSSHALNTTLVKTLLADPSAWTIVDMLPEETPAAGLPSLARVAAQ